jgi:hypothetical protein
MKDTRRHVIHLGAPKFPPLPCKYHFAGWWSLWSDAVLRPGPAGVCSTLPAVGGTTGVAGRGNSSCGHKNSRAAAPGAICMRHNTRLQGDAILLEVCVCYV